MATYAIGDIQGCYDELRRLLDQVQFDPATDHLWCAGDLVNRGPDSLSVLRWVKALGDHAVVVLGNHDLHLLAVAAGVDRRGKKDTLDEVLDAPDRDELLDWLRHRPVMHVSDKKGFAVLHAGLPPQWDLDQAQACARELEAALQDPGHQEFLHAMYGNEPARWSDDLSGIERLRFITNCFTRLRYCDAGGALLLHEKSLPGQQPEGVLPWFQAPGRRTAGDRIIIGHWSTLGFHVGDNVWAIDSGCLWGGHLTAIRVRKKKPIQVFSEDCPGYRQPG
jgi:bis(5'-nucleosyl)-tetraphosphatase (symmetrical)